MHCFSGDTELARQVVELGFFISIPGIVTFKNAKMLQRVVSEIPLQSMLIETDGPFLAPVPYRGKRNEPEFLLHTADKIAELRGTTLAEVAHQTTINATVRIARNHTLNHITSGGGAPPGDQPRPEPLPGR